jgi:hypothetical protein
VSELPLIICYESNVFTIMGDCQWGFTLDIGFIGQFNTQLVTKLNYSAVTNPHTLQITTAHAKSFQSAVSSPVVPW